MCFVLTCIVYKLIFFFFFKQKTAYEMRISDWSSDVCSSDLTENTVPWPTPGPGQERPCAGRSPGSRVNAAMHAFPDLRPVAGPWTEVHRAHRLQLQGQPRNRTVSRPHRIPVFKIGRAHV